LSRAAFLRGVAGAIASAALASRASAQTVGAFYAGRTIRLIIPTAPGGINNLSGRLVARHLGRFIPGSPTIAAENREQGGGLALANSFESGA
jgi:tripartite-type tricarboxylate transporter receptor subunit TctC